MPFGLPDRNWTTVLDANAFQDLDGHEKMNNVEQLSSSACEHCIALSFQ